VLIKSDENRQQVGIQWVCVSPDIGMVRGGVAIWRDGEMSRWWGQRDGEMEG